MSVSGAELRAWKVDSSRRVGRSSTVESVEEPLRTDRRAGLLVALAVGKRGQRRHEDARRALDTELLVGVLDRLERVGVRTITLGAPLVVARDWAGEGVRCSGALELYLPELDLVAVARALGPLGYRPAHVAGARAGRCQLLAGPLPLRLLEPGVDAESLWRASRPRRLGGVPTRLPAAHHALWYQCCEAAGAGPARLDDIVELLGAQQARVDWAAFGELSRIERRSVAKVLDVLVRDYGCEHAVRALAALPECEPEPARAARRDRVRPTGLRGLFAERASRVVARLEARPRLFGW